MTNHKENQMTTDDNMAVGSTATRSMTPSEVAAANDRGVKPTDYISGTPDTFIADTMGVSIPGHAWVRYHAEPHAEPWRGRWATCECGWESPLTVTTSRVVDEFVRSHLRSVAALGPDDLLEHGDKLWPEDVEKLRRWKTETLPILSGLQELGRALGLPLGVLITGREAVDAALDLRNERDAAVAKADAMRKSIISELRTEFGPTNRAADYLSRGES